MSGILSLVEARDLVKLLAGPDFVFIAGLTDVYGTSTLLNG